MHTWFLKFEIKLNLQSHIKNLETLFFQCSSVSFDNMEVIRFHITLLCFCVFVSNFKNRACKNYFEQTLYHVHTFAIFRLWRLFPLLSSSCRPWCWPSTLCPTSTKEMRITMREIIHLLLSWKQFICPGLPLNFW